MNRLLHALRQLETQRRQDGPSPDDDADGIPPILPAVIPSYDRQAAGLLDRIAHNTLRQINSDRRPLLLTLFSTVSTIPSCRVALRLALALRSHVEGKILLVDGDSVSRGIGHLVGLSDTVGWSDMVSQAHDFPSLCRESNCPKLDVLPHGQSPAAPGDSVIIDLVQRLTTHCKHAYAVTVVDAGLWAVGTADAWSILADGVIPLVPDGGESTEMVNKIFHEIALIESPVLGQILVETG